MKFVIDVKVTGYQEVSVDADNLEEAEDKAREKVNLLSVTDLRWKSFGCVIHLPDNDK